MIALPSSSGSIRRRVALVLSALLCSCVLVPRAVAQTAGIERLTVAIPGYENNLTPFTVSFLSLPNTHDLLTLVYDTLFWSQNDKDPEPWLAESATPSADRKQWTVKLRSGITWHDGKPFTADDVKFSFDYYATYPGASGRYAHHAADTPPYDRAEIVDAQTVRLFFKASAPTFPILPGGDLPMIPKHIWESVKEPVKYTALPIGTGPFKMVEAITDQGYRLEANPSYFKGNVLVKKLDLVVIREPTVAFAALRSGEVDHVARNAPAELIGPLTNTKGVKLMTGTRNESVQMLFNARRPPFDDAAVRKGISLAIDNQRIVEAVLLGRAKPGNDNFIHPDSPWALPGSSHENDLTKSRRILDEAGYELKSNSRVNAKGIKIEFDILVSSFEPQQVRTAQLISSQLQQIGVKANVEPIDPATLRQRRAVVAGKIPDYDAYMSILESHAHVDPDGLYYFFHSPGTRGFGAAVTGYSNAAFDSLAEKAVIENDPLVREQELFDMQRILIAEMPVIVLYYPEAVYATRDVYTGWFADPGHGIFTKRSFIAGENTARKAPTTVKAVAPTSAPATTTAPPTTGPPRNTTTIKPVKPVKPTKKKKKTTNSRP